MHLHTSSGQEDSIINILKKGKLQKHNEWWKVNADKEGNMDVNIEEGVIENEVPSPRQYFAQYYREGYKNLKTN